MNPADELKKIANDLENKKIATSITKDELTKALEAVKILIPIAEKIGYDIVYNMADFGEEFHDCNVALLACGLEGLKTKSVDEIYDMFFESEE